MRQVFTEQAHTRNQYRMIEERKRKKEERDKPPTPPLITAEPQNVSPMPFG
jgi:hypothetical protein